MDTPKLDELFEEVARHAILRAHGKLVLAARQEVKDLKDDNLGLAAMADDLSEEKVVSQLIIANLEKAIKKAQRIFQNVAVGKNSYTTKDAIDIGNWLSMYGGIK